MIKVCVATIVVCLFSCVVVLSSPASPSSQTQRTEAQIGGPHLVAISVPSLDAAIAWYRDNLGFVARQQKDFPNYGVKIGMLELDGFWLELFEKKTSFAPKAIQQRMPEIADWDQVLGIKKLAFSVKDLDAVVAKLKRSGVAFQTEVMEDKDDPIFGRSVIVLDNSGNWIQFCERPR